MGFGRLVVLFELESSHRSSDLVILIDPISMVYSSFLGGTPLDDNEVAVSVVQTRISSRKRFFKRHKTS